MRLAYLDVVNVLHSSGDGNCFFDSVHKVLQSTTSTKSHLLHLKSDGKIVYAIGRYQQFTHQSIAKANLMRYVFAKQILVPENSEIEEIITNALNFWKDLLGPDRCEKDLFTEPLQLWFKAQTKIDRIDNMEQVPYEIRSKLYDNLNNKNVYWGDHFAIMILHKLLNIDFVIINRKGEITYSTSNYNQKNRTNILLVHECEHYQPLDTNSITNI